ncbi:hypothetical protein DFQ14_1255 [Halopolyspora algeriensis]|uniref:Uncharacterized protein n=1 Tax=Halopolyspora algeriensis TaxID=1500506 RepID=A0A368V937_9ACTN|nr:hypothetical protein DFQ14_1255 [Halopolyspora algeriensis]TQM53816.1 hypothetical protein FHU43_1985 [Halopolyspora algeriensis]
MSAEIQILQAIRFKGRPAGADLASAVGSSWSAVAVSLRLLVESGRCVEADGCYRLTPAGRDRLSSLTAAERGSIDRESLADAYERFDKYNSELKRIVVDWQLKDGVKQNDHTDPGYDAKVIAQLVELHAEFQPLLADIVDLVPRLNHYPARFKSALDKVRAGTHAWFAGPLIDSYHTVWFELHEDLIGLTGRTRIDEAEARRAE